MAMKSKSVEFNGIMWDHFDVKRKKGRFELTADEMQEFVVHISGWSREKHLD